MSQHTATPWRVREDDDAFELELISEPTSDRYSRVVVAEMKQGWDRALDDGKRVCAAVNACEALSNEALEAGVVGDLLAESEKTVEILVDLQNNHLYSAAAVTRALVQKRIDALKAALAKVAG